MAHSSMSSSSSDDAITDEKPVDVSETRAVPHCEVLESETQREFEVEHVARTDPEFADPRDCLTAGRWTASSGEQVCVLPYVYFKV